jgi:hypothetical protein
VSLAEIVVRRVTRLHGRNQARVLRLQQIAAMAGIHRRGEIAGLEVHVAPDGPSGRDDIEVCLEAAVRFEEGMKSNELADHGVLAAPDSGSAKSRGVAVSPAGASTGAAVAVGDAHRTIPPTLPSVASMPRSRSRKGQMMRAHPPRSPPSTAIAVLLPDQGVGALEVNIARSAGNRARARSQTSPWASSSTTSRLTCGEPTEAWRSYQPVVPADGVHGQPIRLLRRIQRTSLRQGAGPELCPFKK